MDILTELDVTEEESKAQTAQQAIETLEELYAARDLLSIKKHEMIQAVMPEEVKIAVSDIKAEFVQKEDSLNDKIKDAEGRIRGIVKDGGSTVTGKHWQVIYARGSYTVSAKDVLALANRWEKTNPDVAAEIRSILGMSEPKTTIKSRDGGK